MNKRVAILISGGGSNMVSLCDDMQGDHPARPCLVFSNNPNAGGLEKAARRDIPVASIDHKTFGKDRLAFDMALSDLLEKAAPDVICLAGFMRIFTPEFTTRWDGKMLNIHPSLLPKYKGLHTHKRAIEAADREAGCTVHEVTAELDGGPILGQARVQIRDDDTPDTLAERILPLEHKLYPLALRRFLEGNRKRVDLA